MRHKTTCGAHRFPQRSFLSRSQTPCARLSFAVVQLVRSLENRPQLVTRATQRTTISTEAGSKDESTNEVTRGENIRFESHSDSATDLELSVGVLSSIDQVNASEWDRIATSSGEVNPFLLWSFFHALELSRSACTQEGWTPQHLVVRDLAGKLLGVCPLYLKSHSYGEYVFDNAWASFCSVQLGAPYYPKLQSCVPFTPVTGARMMVTPGPERLAVVKALAAALLALADDIGVSSVHITFNTREEWSVLGQLGWLQRTGIQYHWQNNDYTTFDDFLDDLKSSKRKNIRMERKSITQSGLIVRRLHGGEVSPRQWDAFYRFYLSTVDKQWGQAYLTRDFFHRLGATMPDHVLLVMAEDGNNTPMAGALNMAGSHSLFGRNWGCADGLEVKNLHFELCYYQALEEAIQRKLPRVEAGAQGEHKIQRGYLPSKTYSSHYIRDPYFRAAVEQFLIRERMQNEVTWQALTLQASPFKADKTQELFREKLEDYGDMQLVRLKHS